MVFNRLDILIPEYVEHMPTDLQHGYLYISKRFKIAIHLCACGCGGKAVTPLENWKLTDNEGKITLRPSIGNWSGEASYHAHYFINDNEIQWL